MILHVTDLDSLVWYRRIEAMTDDELKARLLRTGPTNNKMLMGTAWHSILENPPPEIGTIIKDGFTFNVDCDAEIKLPQLREVRAGKKYDVDGVTVTLSGKCDGISGTTIVDHKLTFRPNPESYFGSYQWRAYLDIFDADTFTYHLYHATEKDGVVTIKDVSTLNMYRYPGMNKDLTEGISALVWFIKNNVPEMMEAA